MLKITLLLITISMAEEPTIFMSCSNVDATLRREEKNLCFLSLSRLKVTSFSSNGCEALSRWVYRAQVPEVWCSLRQPQRTFVCLLDSTGASSHDSDLLWGSSQIPDWQVYTWYVNLKLSLVHDCEHLMSLFNTKFFCAKFSILKLSRTRQHRGEDRDVYVWRFHQIALDYCDPMVGEVLNDVCLLGWWRRT